MAAYGTMCLVSLFCMNIMGVKEEVGKKNRGV